MTDKDLITWQDFEKIELLTATIIDAEIFKDAKVPAFKLTLDLGNGRIKKSSAQLRALYQPDDLIGKQVICVANFPAKQIGPMMSEVLVTGFYNDAGEVILAVPDKPLHNGAKLG